MEDISEKNKKVGVIRLDISGLLACEYALSKGYTPLVFKSQSTIGGVWTPPLETTPLQTPSELFWFSDFPWPTEVTEVFPNKDQEERRRGKDGNIGVAGGEAFSPSGKWELIAEDTVNHSTKKLQVVEVDFVILAIGRFSDVPNFPEFPLEKGPEAFDGEVVHAMDYRTTAAFVKDRLITSWDSRSQ
ncbi:hypothetical protein CDL15_Pgr004443 [Punica granatum]|uniref:Flavin-containing monooxygenase n=1 Tax=Punica granatum TaxID=22663 RepID=A0A218XI35_PUNGR|nr:hypothetical protein CDL15_Pgr004443 [Punica granatum]